MKAHISILGAILGLLVAASATDLLAAGRGNGGGGNGGYGKRNGSCVRQQAVSDATVTTRPAGSQRRNGTFQSTGVTANGSTVRPGNGNGLQDGSRLNSRPTTTSEPAQ